MVEPMEPGDLLPARDLAPLGGGSAVRVGPNLRRAQVLVVTHAEPCQPCAAYLASLHEQAESFKGECAEVLAIVTEQWHERAASIPVPALGDDGLISSYLSIPHRPAVTVTDRFGQLFACFDAGDDHTFPAPARLLTVLLDIGIGCPECGVPDVPCPTVLPEWDATSAGMRLLQ